MIEKSSASDLVYRRAFSLLFRLCGAYIAKIIDKSTKKCYNDR